MPLLSVIPAAAVDLTFLDQVHFNAVKESTPSGPVQSRKKPWITDLSADEVQWNTLVYDSSVDYKGRIPRRDSTGVWKATLFIIAIEFAERLCYYGIATNLISYLTKVLDQDLETAVKNVNYWLGVTTMMPLLGGFVADAYLGRFRTVLVSSIIYLLGLGLLTLSQFVPSLKSCEEDQCPRPRKVHEIMFFVAMYMISVGTGGHKPSLESFGADQFDAAHPEERKKRMSYFNWWSFGLCSGLVLGVTAVAYVQDFVSWGAGDVIIIAVMAVSTVVFLIGRPFYRYRVPKGSPLTPMAQVLVAAFVKRKLPYPSNPAKLYEVHSAGRGGQSLLGHTSKLRFLDKAAIVENGKDIQTQPSKKESPWRLATVTKVEEMKLVVNMVPIWLACLVFGICVDQTATFFIKQASVMDRKLTSHFTLPPATIYALAAIGMIITVTIYDKLLFPYLRKVTGTERGISILQRIGIGMAVVIVGLICAALVEKKRLNSVETEKVEGSTMGVFWLAPQFLIFGVGDGFALVGLQEYFYDQVPETMRSLGIAFYLSVIGASNFLSSLLITLVDHVTEKSGGSSWFAKDLNSSRLDNFYWLLAAMGGINLCVYMFLASRYSYKNEEKRVADADSYESDDVGAIP
ncbi:protein NRT1/ PTR FAMILY 5.6-like [Aristolochia californica]|uniref:protein NRT1/ PTR FAMILY 5.6-like n=1 Tax=Aristolochia californica TaxID=171875 RepID=UPI0035DFC0A9